MITFDSQKAYDEAIGRAVHALDPTQNEYWQFQRQYLDAKWGRTYELWLASLGNPTIQDVAAGLLATRIEVRQDSTKSDPVSVP
ncbi:hypothetical protein FTO74_01170 [Granulicella sp. WH15]|nr:hypothetical protein FTO74_01170 [Granulicella sp. WH15]